MQRASRVILVCAGLAGALGGSCPAWSQVAGGGGGGAGGGGGFFGGGGYGGAVAFNPEPSAVFSGAGMWVGATVSADRKYVNLGMVPQFTQVTSVQNFPIYFAGGFVGSENAGGEVTTKAPLDPGIKGGSAEPPMLVSASAPFRGVLAAPGMTKLAALD